MKTEYIPIITRGSSAKIKVSDVVLIEKENRKLKFITDDDTEYCLYGKMDEIAPLLDERFYPCMSTCIINLDKVESMEKSIVKFESGRNMIVGRDNFIKTRQVYNAYLRKLFIPT